jgi:MFS family permease
MQVSAGAFSPRTTMTVVFGAFGAAIGALAGSMPSVMRNAGLDAETFGLGLTISTFITVAAMASGGQIARFASNRHVLLIVLPVFALALLAYLTSRSPVWFFMAIPLMGLCFGLTDLFMNAEAVALEHDMRRPVFMAFHGAVSAGVAMMAVATSFLSTAVGTWSAGAVVAALLAVAWVMVYCGVAPRPPAKGTAGRLPRLPNKGPLMLLGVAAGLIIAAETAALLWSAKLLDEMAPALAAIAGVGAAFFGLCNAAVRFPGDRLRSSAGDMPLMVASLAISIIGFAALGISTNYLLSVVSFAAVGFGLALLIPCIFGLSARLVPANRAGALSFVSLLSAAPRILAPLAFGLAAAEFGTAFAFGLVAGGLLVALLLILAFARGRWA